MEEIVRFLNDNPIQYIATVGIDNKPCVRPFQFMLRQDNRLYFCTSNQKDIYKQLQNNPYIELSVSDSNFTWLRLKGKVKFDNDINIKNKIIQNNQLVRSIYKTSDNPMFEIFYLENMVATITDFSGNAPKIFKI